jgi:hypothetical protein
LIGGLVLVALGVGGWFLIRGRGETVEDVRARYRPQFAELRAKMRRVAANLPPVGSVKADTLPANLDPQPVSGFDLFTGNTAEVMAVHCEGAGPYPKAPDEFEQSSFRFLDSLRETREGAEPDRRRAPEDLAQEYERALAVKYLIVYRAVRFVKLEVNQDSFTGGELDLEVFLVDLGTEKPVGAIRRSLQPKPEISAKVRKGSVDTSTVKFDLYRDLTSKASSEVHRAFYRGTNEKSK